MRTLIPVIATLLFVSACSTMSKKDCQNQQWQAAGYDDATMGLKPTRFNAHAKACAKHGIEPNQPLYQSGFDDGLQAYCTPYNGAREGRNFDRYHGTCPADLESGFLSGYLDGLEIALNKVERDFYETRHYLDIARHNRLRATSDADKRKYDRQIEKFINNLRHIQSERSQIKSAITRWSYRTTGY